MRTIQRVILVAVIAAFLIIVGIVGGVLMERVRFDHRRSVVLRQYEERLRERNETLMKTELSQPRSW